MTKKWLVIFFIVLIWSGINPKDYFTWALEVMPALIALALLIITNKKFKFTKLAYALILVHCIILMVGGHYTYAEVPLFDWLKGVFNFHRNNYDKVGHFAQGFIPAIIAREILIRNKVVNNKYWLIVFIVSVCLSISALYELVEWWVAEFTGESATAFLGTQGYMWDTQSDMAFALLGSILSLVLLSRYHDRQLEKMKT